MKKIGIEKMEGKNLKKSAALCLFSGQRASLTIEAALSLTLFFFTVILLAMPMDILDTQRRVQTVMETVAREWSQMAYVAYRKKLGEENIGSARSSGSEQEEGLGKELGKEMGEAAVKASLLQRVKRMEGAEKIKEVDFSGTRIWENGEWIEISARYQIRLPFSVFSLDAVELTSRSRRRGWIGSEGKRFSRGEGEGLEEEMVYVGKTSTRYHLSASCHYLSNDISVLPYGELSSKRNTEGKKYQPCRVCGSGAKDGNTVFVLPGGESYHSRTDCPSLSYYIKKVPLKEAEHLGPCSYCGKGG